MASPAPDPSSLPPQVQIFVYIGAGLAALFLSLYGYFIKGRKRPTEDYVITSAEIADTKPMRDLADAVKALKPQHERIAAAAERTATAVEAMRELFEREADEEDRRRIIQEEVARGVAEELARRTPPSARQRKLPPHR